MSRPGRSWHNQWFLTGAVLMLAMGAASGCSIFGLNPLCGGGGEEGDDECIPDDVPPPPPPPIIIPPPPVGAGATQGGVQDLTFARELIENGVVPRPEAFLVEGMFSEHDLGLVGEPCTEILCLDGAFAIAPMIDGTPSAWLQIGMSSSIDLATFTRPSLTIVAAVDVSGSMRWGYGPDEVTPASLARELLSSIAAELGAGDRIAIVTYGDQVQTPLTMTSGANQDAITQVINNLSDGGSTNMEAGLARAFSIAGAATGQTDEVRVLLFTDVQPNVGATEDTEFEQMAEGAASQGVGLTVFGLGLGLGTEVMTAMSHLRGGNAFTLTRAEHVGELMADDWPFLASPIAYDLALHVNPANAVSVAEAYGIPADASGTVGLEVSTVFLSRRKGALLVRLEPEQAPLESFSISTDLRYVDSSNTTFLDGFQSQYSGEPLDARGHYYEQPGIAKTVALALLVSGMRDAAELYAQDPQAAVDLMTALYARFDADATALADSTLDPERDLAAALLALMEMGASQGDFYPGQFP